MKHLFDEKKFRQMLDNRARAQQLIDFIDSEIRRNVKEALEKYGRHETFCDEPTEKGLKCTCGFDIILREMEK